jgi:hypothetical protein
MKAFNGEIAMWKLAVAIIGLTLLFGAAPAWAQSPADPHHQPAAASGAMQAQPDGGTMPMMDMCRQMMASPTMGMGGDQKMEPKMMAHMLQMRGEMMKAMGEVMMKHGKMMQGGATK